MAAVGDTTCFKSGRQRRGCARAEAAIKWRMGPTVRRQQTRRALTQLMMHGDRAALDRRRQTGSAKLWLDKLRQDGMPIVRWSHSPTGIVWSMLSSVACQPDCRLKHLESGKEGAPGWRYFERIV